MLSFKRRSKDGAVRKSGFAPRGVCESPKYKAEKLAFLAESSRQANELTKQRQLRQAYTKFFKTEDGRAFARSFGKSITSNRSRYMRNGNGETDVGCDPTDLPHLKDASSLDHPRYFDHPIDHIEPSEDHRPLDGLTREDIKTTTEIFEASMRWCIDGRDLVSIGLRSAIVISIMKPDLRFGLRIDARAAKVFVAANKGVNGAMKLTGSLFGPVLEWLRRGDKPSERGERIMVLFYVLRPDLIGESTLAELGRISNKTRQAKDKLANCLRDTYSGIRARAMRGDITRIRCRESQLSQ